MSEPLTSHEIEDVLSSIRRLVSDELRPIARTVAPATPPSALLLTPALRIVPESIEEIAEPDATNIAAPVEDVLPAPVGNAAEHFSEWTMAPPTEDYDDQHPADDVAFASRDEVIVGDIAYSGATGTDWNEVSDVLWSSAGTPDGGAFEDAAFDDRPSGDQDASRSFEAPLDRLSDQAETDTSWAEVEEWHEQQPASFAAHPRKPVLASDPLARAWADKAEAEVRADLGDTLASPAKEPRKAAVPPPEPPRTTAAPEAGLFDGSDPELDEESLREIVREIIREELSGALGERITRNVRKLVRVEINRALTAREFE